MTVNLQDLINTQSPNVNALSGNQNSNKGANALNNDSIFSNMGQTGSSNSITNTMNSVLNNPQLDNLFAQVDDFVAKANSGYFNSSSSYSPNGSSCASGNCSSGSSSSYSPNGSSCASGNCSSGSSNSASGTNGTSSDYSQYIPSTFNSIQNNANKNISGNDAAEIQKLKDNFDKTYNHSSYLSKAKSNNSSQMYFLSIPMAGLAKMYEATGDKKYIQNLLELSEAYINAGKDMDGDGYKDWKGTAGQAFNHTHHEWRGAIGIAQTIELIKNNPELSEFDNRANQLAGFVEKHVWEKWNKVSGRNGKMENNKNISFIGRLGSVAANMYKATGDQKYLDFIKKHGQAMKNEMNKRSSGSTLSWGYDIGMSGVSDTSHAGDAIQFMVDAYKLGVVFDENDIQKAVNTVKKIWNGSTSSPKFKDNMNGSGSYGSQGDNQAGWAALAEFDPVLQQIYSGFTSGSKEANRKLNVLGYLANALAYS